MKVDAVFIFLSSLTVLARPLSGQTATLHGQITDETGAVVRGATVTLTGLSGSVQSVVSKGDGTYTVSALAPGYYTIQASAPNLGLPTPMKASLKPGTETLNLQLKVVVAAQRVNVAGDAGPTVTTDAASNATATVLRGSDLNALGDDPEDLQSDLQALAGPSAGPSGGEIYIDGFSGGELPSKDAIREIRINQNPFSPEYDKLGYGRIEIITKPGAQKFHGTAYYNFGDSFWNSRNPYAAEKAPFLLKEYGASLTGPLNQRTTFFMSVDRAAIDNGAIINGSTLDPSTLAIIDPYTQVFGVPQRRVILSPRVDRQVGASGTLSLRYRFETADIQPSGIGSFNLVSTGTHNHTDSQTAQVAYTAVVGANAVNETRFHFYHLPLSTIANEPQPTLEVMGSFIGGGGQAGHSSSVENDYELQNYTSLLHGQHSWRFGVRVRAAYLNPTSPVNFGGTYIFTGGIAPQLNAANEPVLGPDGQPVLVNLTSIEEYQRTVMLTQMDLPPAQVRALGGGASQFTAAVGNTRFSLNQWDVGAFGGDDWRARPNFTLSYGCATRGKPTSRIGGISLLASGWPGRRDVSRGQYPRTWSVPVSACSMIASLWPTPCWQNNTEWSSSNTSSPIQTSSQSFPRQTCWARSQANK